MLTYPPTTQQLSLQTGRLPTYPTNEKIYVLPDSALKALDKLESLPGLVTYNLGTGNGYSVLDMVNAFSKASGREVAYKIVDRRPGDVAMCYANPKKANEELGWEAKFGIEEMCQDAWRWQSNNPNGYRVEELELV